MIQVKQIAYSIDFRKDGSSVLFVERSSAYEYRDEGEMLNYDFILEPESVTQKDMTRTKFYEVVELANWARQNLKQL